MTGILPIDAKFSVAPLANSTGFKSDIGLALVTLLANDCIHHKNDTEQLLTYKNISYLWSSKPLEHV